MTQNSKIGRPKIKDEMRKGSVLTLRLSVAERAEIDKAAGSAPASTWAREILLANARKKR